MTETVNSPTIRSKLPSPTKKSICSLNTKRYMRKKTKWYLLFQHPSSYYESHRT